MRAASWDITWEVGGPWGPTRLHRRTPDGVRLPLVAPCRMEIRRSDDPSTTPPLHVIEGVLRSNGDGADYWELRATAAETRLLGPGSFQFALLLGIPGEDPNIWARGFIRARDRTGDQG